MSTQSRLRFPGSRLRFPGLLVATFVLAIAPLACRTATILTPQVGLSAVEERTEADVASAIKAAGLRYGWEMTDDGPGQITGTLHQRQHTAVVSISYNAMGYRIEYKDSEQLLHSKNKIHRSYNRWVRNLSEAIHAQIGHE